MRNYMPLAGQLAGSAVAGYGLYLLVGLAWTLVAVGVAVVAVGTLAEMRT